MAQPGDNRPTGQETAIILRKKITARRAAIQLFTEMMQQGIAPGDEELGLLREVGISEPEIAELVSKLSGS